MTTHNGQILLYDLLARKLCTHVARRIGIKGKYQHPRSGLVQDADDIQEGGLPRSAGAHEGYELALVNRQIDLLQRRNSLAALAVAFRQVVDFQKWHVGGPP